MGYLEVNTRAFDEECVNKNQQKEGELCQKSAKSPEIYLQMIKSRESSPTINYWDQFQQVKDRLR